MCYLETMIFQLEKMDKKVLYEHHSVADHFLKDL